LAAVHSLIVIALSLYTAKIQLFPNARQLPQNFMAIRSPRVRDWSTLSQGDYAPRFSTEKEATGRSRLFRQKIGAETLAIKAESPTRQGYAQKKTTNMTIISKTRRIK
jgi:hypothetical protein